AIIVAWSVFENESSAFIEQSFLKDQLRQLIDGVKRIGRSCKDEIILFCGLGNEFEYIHLHNLEAFKLERCRSLTDEFKHHGILFDHGNIRWSSRCKYADDA